MTNFPSPGLSPTIKTGDLTRKSSNHDSSSSNTDEKSKSKTITRSHYSNSEHNN